MNDEATIDKEARTNECIKCPDQYDACGDCARAWRKIALKAINE